MEYYHDYFGEFGGKYVAEILRAPLDELEAAFLASMADPGFQAELEILHRDFVGRPTPLYYAENASRKLGGGQIYIKLEGLANTGAHKINNALGQAPPGQADGQEPDHRRDRSRPAWPGHRRRLREARSQVPRLHGAGGHHPPAAQRVLDGAVSGPRWSR